MDLQKLYQIIKKFEGCILTPYMDSGGVWTCGWGSTGWDVIPGKLWSQEYADTRMVQVAESMAARIVSWCPGATDNQLCALSDFAYNVGSNNLRTSTLLRKFRSGYINGAADEFLRWNKCHGKVLKGLTIRRIAERELFLCG